MGSRRGHFFSALAGLIVGVMLVAVLSAGADNGDPIYLGQANIAKATTRISVNYGMVIRSFRADVPAATFKVSSGAPIAVNSTGWVENLNADLLDGLEASAFSTDGHPHVWSDLTSGVPAGLADGDDDALGGLACAAGQVAKSDSGATSWECAEDDDTTYTDPEAVAAILGADGSGSGLDADLLDGSDSTDFADSAQRCPYGWTAAGFDTDGGMHCGGFVTVDETGDIGSDPSVVLDASGYPVIAYGGGGNLKLARCHDAYCMSITINTVDADPLTHRWPSTLPGTR